MSQASRAREQSRRDDHLHKWLSWRANQGKARAELMSSNEVLPVRNRIGGDACRGWLREGLVPEDQIDTATTIVFTGLASEHRAQQEALWLAGTPVPPIINPLPNT